MTLRIRTTLIALACVFTLVPFLAAQKPLAVGIQADGLSAAEREPLRAYLAKQMGREVKLVILNNYNEYLAALGDGSLDFSALGAVNYCRAHSRYGVIPLVRRPDSDFHTVFITGANSHINSLADLKGKEMAFVDPYSTSGYVLPTQEMKKAGVAKGDVRPHFTGAHPNVAKLVESGVVDAGALDDAIYQSMLDQGKLDRSKVRVFYTTKPYIDWVYVARKDLSEAERQRFARALEALTPGRDDAILKIVRAKKFVPAKDDEYASIRQTANELHLLE